MCSQTNVPSNYLAVCLILLLKTWEKTDRERERREERMRDWRRKINYLPAFDRERTVKRGRCRESGGKKGLQRMKNKDKITTSAKACLSCVCLVSTKSLLDNKGKG